MAAVLHKTNRPTDYRPIANTPDFPTADWFINPDISAVAGVDQKYWNLDNPTTEMDAAAKAVVDAAQQAAQVTSSHEELTIPVNGSLPEGVDIRALIQLANRRDNFLTNRMIELQDRVQAMLNSTGNISNMRTDGLAVSISATATRPLADAITDYTTDVDAGLAD